MSAAAYLRNCNPELKGSHPVEPKPQLQDLTSGLKGVHNSRIAHAKISSCPHLLLDLSTDKKKAVWAHLEGATLSLQLQARNHSMVTHKFIAVRQDASPSP